MTERTFVKQIHDGREFLHAPKTRLRIARKKVTPSLGEAWMRCGNCGGMSMKPLVRGVEGGTAKVVALVCDDSRGGGCLAVYKLDIAGCMEKGGNFDNATGAVVNE